MPISVRTNVSSLTTQRALNGATTSMNTAMERLSTGYRINSSKDDAAGMAVSSKLNYKISSLKVAQTNGQMGASMLDTSEGVYKTIQENLQRLRDLTEQAANGTYGSDSMSAIVSEVTARINEITRVANSTEFNGQFLMNGSITHDIHLQVGIDSSVNSIITLTPNLFQDTTAKTLLNLNDDPTDPDLPNVKEHYQDDATARAFLANIDAAIASITDRISTIGGVQQQIISAMSAAQVMMNSYTNSTSLIQDTDVASESSAYVQNQILQQISASMLSTANQSPSVALGLLG